METDTYKKLLRKAGSLLARRPYSRGELRNKLAKMGDSSHVEIVLDRLERLNLLNDVDYAYNFTLNRVTQQGWSIPRVSNSLQKRQVAQSTIDSVTARIHSERGDENSLNACIEKYCGRKGRPSDAKDVGRLVSHLRRHGFDADDIQRALKSVLPDKHLRRFETGD